MNDPTDNTTLERNAEARAFYDDDGDDNDLMMDIETFQNLLSPLLSCGICREILIDPVTLQCGNTLCRRCLPGSLDFKNCETLEETDTGGGAAQRSDSQSFWRAGNNYSLQVETPSSTTGDEKWIPPVMRERFDCPFTSCQRKQHSRDLSSSYILQNLLDIIPSSNLPLYSEKAPPLEFNLPEVKSRIQSELDCQICYLLLHDPITTPCGHTFCRPCLLRSSDHATHPVCPTCRSPVLLPTPQNTPTNILIDNLIRTLFPSADAERAAAETLERHASSSGVNTPIFVCTLALPSIECLLHIFEPRYRLMIRRCIAGDRRFGMVLPRSRVGRRYNDELRHMNYITPQEGELPTGSLPTFMQYGTMLEIRGLQMLPDGRSLVETVGRERFRIHDWSVRDGYIVAKTTSLPDLEPYIYSPPSPDVVVGLTTNLLANTSPEELPTNELVYLTRLFVQELRRVPWLSARLQEPELEEQLRRLDSRDDAVRFAWWVGSKMPMEEREAYTLLLQTGVRELFCVLGSWIGEMERQSWYVPS
jgi:hypothetical protein